MKRPPKRRGPWAIQQAIQAEVDAFPEDAPAHVLGAFLERQPHERVAGLYRRRPLDGDHRRVLLELSEHRWPEVRRWSLECLRRGARDETVARRFQRAAAEDPSTIVRRVAWEQLARTPAPAAWLDGVHESDPRLRTSWLMAQAAGRPASRDPGLLGVCASLADTEYPDLVGVRTAIGAVASLWPEQLTPRLRALRDDLRPHPSRRWQQLPPWSDAKARQVHAALGDPDPARRLLAADLCRRELPPVTRSPGEVPEGILGRLEYRAQREGVPSIRWAMRNALRRFQVTRGMVYRGAAFACGRRVFLGAFLSVLPPEQGMLARLVSCNDAELRALAAMAMQSSPELQAANRGHLRFASNDPSRRVRRVARSGHARFKG